MMKRDCAIIWSRLFLFTLLAVVAALASYQVHQYFRKVTIVGRNVKRKDSLYLPAISFCPGFRSDVVRQNPWHNPSYDFMENADFFVNSAAEDGKNLTKLWELATFELEDIVVLVKFKGVGKKSEERYTPNTLKNATCVKIEMQEAASGKCFTVLSSQAPECTLKRREYITLVFNLSSVFRKAMDLTFHEPEDPFGLNEENWSGEVSSTTIHSQGVYNIGLDVTISVTSHNTRWTDFHFFECVENIFYSMLHKAINEGERLCWHPSFANMLKKMPEKDSIPICANVTSYTATNKLLLDSLVLSAFQTNLSECPKPGRETTYPIRMAKQHFSPSLEDGITIVYILFQESDITMLEEKLILDWPMLLASLGGTVGIFLGWSFLDLSAMLLAVVERLWKRRAATAEEPRRDIS